MANELSKSDEAAFAAMQQAEIVAEPEPEPEEIEQPAESVDDEADETAAAVVEGRNKTVPHQALHAEREEHRKTREELAKAREERARFDERLKLVMERQQEREPPKDERPAEDDYVGRLEYAERRLAEIEQGGEQQTEQQRQQAVVQHLAQTAFEDARQFRAKTPDYGDAYEYWKTNRSEELKAFGIPPAQIPGILGQEELAIAHGAFQRGVSPAETIYNVAKHRGFKAKSAPQIDGEAVEHVERVERGQQRSQTLSGTGGGAAPTEMTASRLLAMSNDEFDAWTTKNPAKAARLMGQEPPRRRT